MARTLPPGFDPVTGRLVGVGTPSNRNTSYGQSGSSTTYSPSRPDTLWGRFNRGVASIGNWIDDGIDTICTVVMWIIIIGIAIAALIGIISMISNGHLVGAILLIVFGGAIAYYGTAAIGWIGFVATAAVLYVIRYILWNAWSLMATIIVAGGIFLYVSYKHPSGNETKYERVEVVSTTTYTCTTYALNVRSGPSTSYRSIGTLKKGDRIEVIRITNDFAEFKYNGSTAYASVKYLAPVYGN